MIPPSQVVSYSRWPNSRNLSKNKNFTMESAHHSPQISTCIIVYTSHRWWSIDGSIQRFTFLVIVIHNYIIVSRPPKQISRTNRSVLIGNRQRNTLSPPEKVAIIECIDKRHLRQFEFDKERHEYQSRARSSKLVLMGSNASTMWKTLVHFYKLIIIGI